MGAYADKTEDGRTCRPSSRCGSWPLRIRGGVLKKLRKPPRLRPGDTVAAISPCNGWAGDEKTRWKYELGVAHLREIGLRVVPAPYSLKGSAYLSKHPEARAEDFLWAFESQDVKAIIANVGGNDSHKLIPYLRRDSVEDNPKIFIGYSDAMNLHLFCYSCGLSSFYGDNLLSTVAETGGWHRYSKKWFCKVLFDPDEIGPVEPAGEWTWEPPGYSDPAHVRTYYPNPGYVRIQGQGIVRGRLFGGHTGLRELADTPLSPTREDFRGVILFLEDIPAFFTPQAIEGFLHWLEGIGALGGLRGILIGKAAENTDFTLQAAVIRRFLSSRGLDELPVLYGLHFGHSSPSCILPYGAMAEIRCDAGAARFSILDGGVA